MSGLISRLLLHKTCQKDDENWDGDFSAKKNDEDWDGGFSAKKRAKIELNSFYK